MREESTAIHNYINIFFLAQIPQRHYHLWQNKCPMNLIPSIFSHATSQCWLTFWCIFSLVWRQQSISNGCQVPTNVKLTDINIKFHGLVVIGEDKLLWREQAGRCTWQYLRMVLTTFMIMLSGNWREESSSITIKFNSIQPMVFICLDRNSPYFCLTKCQPGTLGHGKAVHPTRNLKIEVYKLSILTSKRYDIKVFF